MTGFRTTAVASTLLCAVGLSVSAFAAATTTPSGTGIVIRPQGMVSVTQLAGSQANIDMLKAQHVARPLEMLRHRLPNGGSTARAPVALPRMAAPNAFLSGVNLASPPGHISGFTGIYEGSNAAANGGGELEPPDQGMAVNNGQVVEIVNNTFQVFTSRGAALSSPLANATFFGTGSSYNLSDPHVVFDPSTQRWFVEELMWNSSFYGFAVAVSTSSNPLGSYYIYYISDVSSGISACGGACLPDYPQVGFDRNGFYIGADLFANGGGSGFVETALYALPKAALEAGSGFTYVYFQLPDFVVQPAIPAPGASFVSAANGTEYAMTARNIYDGSTNVRVWAISNTNNLGSNPTSLYGRYVDIGAEAYNGTVPSTQPDVIGPYGQSVGATSAPRLDGGYNSFGGGVKYASGKLFAALATGTTDGNGLQRDVIAWFVVHPVVTSSSLSGSIYAQGYIVPPNGYSMSYPDFAVNKGGAGIIGSTITNPNQSVTGGFPSTCFIDFLSYAPTGSLYVVGAGATSDDGFTGYSGPGPAGVGRWGDYGQATVDPVTKRFFVANEFISNPSGYPRGYYANWGTFVTEVY